MSGHCYATISLICMSTHKATAARCISYHQATYGQPPSGHLPRPPLRRLALSVLFTIATNSYQTTCTISERTFNKRQHANARHGVDFSLFTHYDTRYLCRLQLRKSENTQPTRQFPFSQNSQPFREVTVDFPRVLYMFLLYFCFCLHIK